MLSLQEQRILYSRNYISLTLGIGDRRNRIQHSEFSGLGGKNASYPGYLKIYLFVDKSRFSLEDQNFSHFKTFSFLYITTFISKHGVC